MALSSSPNQFEAEVALQKAHHLMTKYNIKTVAEERQSEYALRPVGLAWGKIPSYVSIISNIVKEFYFVKTIRIPYSHVRGMKTTKNGYKTIELFGKPENLEIAEYVFHFLLTQGEILWAKFKSERAFIRGIYSKTSYLTGLYMGYQQKLEDEHDVIEEELDEESYSLIRKGDKVLSEMYNRQHPRIHSIKVARHEGGGFRAGHEAGRNLQFRPGVTNNERTKQRLLN
jgi:hypothetical protein